MTCRLGIATVARRAAVALALLGAGSPAQAEAQRFAEAQDDRSGLAWMSGDEIRAEFSGKSLAGRYPSDRSWSEQIRPDGTSDYREGTKHWIGRWWIEGREFCFSYQPPGVGGCFRVTRISANCFELYEFGSGRHGSGDAPPNIADVWNGRMWHADRPLTCEARPSV